MDTKNPVSHYSETSLSGHSVRPPLYRGHLCKSPMLLFPALCDRYKEVSLYSIAKLSYSHFFFSSGDFQSVGV